jgi:hypothetical protein
VNGRGGSSDRTHHHLAPTRYRDPSSQQIRIHSIIQRDRRHGQESWPRPAGPWVLAVGFGQDGGQADLHFLQSLLAMTAISDATYQPLESIRTFLDSRHGRHFADDVLNELHTGSNLKGAIDAATQRWMGWTIGRQTSKH